MGNQIRAGSPIEQKEPALKRVSVYMIASDGNGGIIETDISKHLKDFEVVRKEGSVLLNASSLQIELPNSLIKQMSEI